MLEKFYSNKKVILKKSQDFFYNSSSLIPKIGIELEFFLFQNSDLIPVGKELLEDFILILRDELEKNFPLFYEAEKEQGLSQIEIKTIFTADLTRLANEVDEVKEFLKSFARNKNLFTSFSSKPLFDDCGSALQFSISLHDSEDKNLFEVSEICLESSISGLLENTNSMMIFLAEKEEDYLRFSYESNRNLFKQGKFTAPVNLSFGGDNRTCAIRTPMAKKNIPNLQAGKRLEYRVASCDADLNLTLSAILLAINSGIKNKSNFTKSGFTKVFGNAFDEQYCLKNFCQNLEEAKRDFWQEENFIRKKMQEFLSHNV